MSNIPDCQRIVITGVGLVAPGANDLATFRKHLLEGKNEIESIEHRYIGTVPAGLCHFEETKYRKRKENKRGTRAGCLAVYTANEAIVNAGISLDDYDRARVGVYTGLTEHGTVETEHEVFNISQFDYNTDFWTHHHNPRTVLNSPAGEITLNLNITGPHYSIGAACAAGNASVIQGAQMLKLGEVDLAIAGGVSESPQSFGIFAGFKAQGALGQHDDLNKVSRPFDMGRNGIVVSEGSCLYTLERLDDAKKRGATIIGEVAGYSINSDASDFVLPNSERQVECMHRAMAMAGMNPSDIDIVNTHATSTKMGDIQECTAIREVFTESDQAHVNNTKSYIGHAMGAAGALELAGNLPSFEDNCVHPTINLDNIDPECEVPNLVANTARENVSVKAILNNSFGMVGINSALIVSKYSD